MYSVEVRKHALDLIEKYGKTIAEVAKAMNIADRTLKCWRKKFKLQGNLEPDTHKERKRKLDSEELLAELQKNNDATLKELGQKFGVSDAAIHKRLKLLNMTFKKKSLGTSKEMR